MFLLHTAKFGQIRLGQEIEAAQAAVNRLLQANQPEEDTVIECPILENRNGHRPHLRVWVRGGYFGAYTGWSCRVTEVEGKGKGLDVDQAIARLDGEPFI